MNILGFVIGTGILWILDAMLVNPLSHLISNLGHRELQLSPVSVENEEAQPNPGVAPWLYIVVDVLVLGIAGFILGLTMGWFFIGISTKAKGWPGMIAFIVLSIAGSTIHG